MKMINGEQEIVNDVVPSNEDADEAYDPDEE